MTRPPPPRRHTGPALAACAVLGTTALGLLVGHGNTSAAAVRAVMPLPPLSTIATRAVLSPSDSRTTPLHVTTTVERTRTLRAVSTSYVTAPTRTVFATRTATATVTAVRTVTATATQTVTQTATTTVTTTETAVPSP